MNHKQLEQYRDDIKSRVVRIETIVERVESQLSKLNGRTSSLESWKSWMTGGMALLLIGITIAIGVM
jgi:flagellar capping protein FliD